MTIGERIIIRKLAEGGRLIRNDHGSAYTWRDEHGRIQFAHGYVRAATVYSMAQSGLLEFANENQRRRHVPTAFALAALEEFNKNK